MDKFMQKYQPDVIGTLQGYDRLLIRGTIRSLMYAAGIMGFLSKIAVLVKDFGDYAEKTTERMKEASLRAAKRLERPVGPMPHGQKSKEQYARAIAARDRITRGLICVVTAVEPCWSYEIHKNRQTGQRQLHRSLRKCLHFYHYWMHETFGFMHARLQTWFPFTLQICVNGREWLAHQMDAQGMAYQRADNCFTRLEDVGAAQDLMNEFLKLPWTDLLKDISRQANPLHEEIFKDTWNDYYWTIQQSEWATDIMFRSPEALNRIYPLLVRGAIESFSCTDVLRFFYPRRSHPFSREVRSEYKELSEGIRVKHWMDVNSVKAYNKAHSLFRGESTLNDPTRFKVYRPSQTDPHGPCRWLPMTKSIVEIGRRAAVSQAINNRYLDALASLDTDIPLRELIEPVCQSIRWKNQTIRGLRPWTSHDRTLLQAINRGEFTVNGFRNRDIVAHLYCSTSDPSEAKRRAAATTRKLRMLRAHGIIAKIPHTHRYRVSPKGRNIVSAILQSQVVTLQQLNKAVA